MIIRNAASYSFMLSTQENGSASLLKALREKSNDPIDPHTLETYRDAIGLIDQKAILNEDTQDTLLLLCVKSPNKQLRKLAIECLTHGADPKVCDNNDVTALHYATYYKMGSLIEALLEHGASPLCKSKGGNLPLDLITLCEANHETIKRLIMHSPEMLQMTLKNGSPVWLALLKLCISIENHDELVIGGSDPSWLLPFLVSHLGTIGDLNAADHEGQTALQHCRGNCHRIFIELILKGAVVQKSEQEQQTILKSCDVMMARNLSGASDLAFFSKLVEQDALPDQFMPSGAHPKAFFIRMTGEFDTWDLSRENVEDLEAFGRLICACRAEEELSEKMFLVKRLTHIMTRMDSKYQSLLDACQDEISNRHAFALKIFENVEQDPENWELPQGVFFEIDFDRPFSKESFGFQPEDLLFLALQRNRIDLIPNILLKVIAAKEIRDPREVKIETINKPIVHFLLDKTVIKDKSVLETSVFEGGTIYKMAVRLVKAMRSLQSQGYPKKILEHLARLETALLRSAKWSYMRTSASTSKEIAEAISTITLDHPVLIPSCIPTHAMHLAVELMPEGTLRLILYNTGLGILTNHPQWKNSNRLQTFIVIEHIEFNHLTEDVLWKDFFAFLEKIESKDIEQFYAFFRNNLGQGKPVLSASKHSEDYEQKQMRGTCAAQNLMACFRHQIMQKTPGAPSDKLAQYKMIKSSLLLELLEDDIDHIEEDIKQMTEIKRSKHQATAFLAKQAENQSSFETSLEELSEVLGGSLDLHEIKTDTTSARFSLLKSCSKKIAKGWIKAGKVICPKMSENFQLALSLFEAHQITEQRLEQQLEECHNLKQYDLFAEKIAYLMTSSKFKALAKKWLLIEQEDPQKIEALRRVLEHPKYKKAKSVIAKWVSL